MQIDGMGLMCEYIVYDNNYILIQRMSMLKHQSLTQYSIVKFHQEQILLQHKHTHQLYRYYHLKFTSLLYNQQRSHPLLESPIVLPTGVLYPQHITSLSKSMQSRSQQNHFQEIEIVNTLTPIVECLEYLHQKGICHGGICSDGIVFDQHGQIKIRNVVDITENIYYPDAISSFFNDFRALGYVMLELITLQPLPSIINNVHQSIKRVIHQYSKGLIYAIIAMINSFTNYLPKLHQLINNQISQNHISLHLKQAYRKILATQKKQGLLSHNIIETLHMEDHLRKYDHKNHTKVNDSENKLMKEDKKHYLDKISKIIQKNNQFMNQIKSNNSSIRLNPQILNKINTFNKTSAIKPQKEGMFLKKNKQQVMIFSSPLKKLRMMSNSKGIS